jgi:hypothetical protein
MTPAHARSILPDSALAGARPGCPRSGRTAGELGRSQERAGILADRLAVAESELLALAAPKCELRGPERGLTRPPCGPLASESLPLGQAAGCRHRPSVVSEACCESLAGPGRPPSRVGAL